MFGAGPNWTFHEQDTFLKVKYFVPEVAKKFPKFSGLIRAAPVIDDKLNIYLSTVSEGKVYRFTADGKQQWVWTSGAQLPGIPSIMDGKLFSATSSGKVFALDMETGEEIWRRHYMPFVAGDTWATAAAEGVVIVPGVPSNAKQSSNNRLLAAFRASDGEPLWTFDAGADIYNLLVAIKDGSCVFSTAQGKVYRLDLQTGKTIWTTPEPKGGFTTGGSVLGPDGTVYTTWNEWNGRFQEGMVGAHSFADGRPLWTQPVHYEANNAPAVGVLGSGPNARLAIAIGLGSNPETPNVAQGLYSGRGGRQHEARIVALDAATGQPRWSHELPTWNGAALGDDSRPDICLPDAFSNVAIGGDGTVYVGFQNGNIYGVMDQDGDGAISDGEVSTWQAGAAFQGSPGIADGMLVATSCDGMHVFRFPKA